MHTSFISLRSANVRRLRKKLHVLRLRKNYVPSYKLLHLQLLLLLNPQLLHKRIVILLLLRLVLLLLIRLLLLRQSQTYHPRHHQEGSVLEDSGRVEHVRLDYVLVVPAVLLVVTHRQPSLMRRMLTPTPTVIRHVSQLSTVNKCY